MVRADSRRANLFEDLGSEVSERIVLYTVTDLDWVAADLAVFNVDLAAHRQVENHRNLFPAIWAGERVLHQESMLQRLCDLSGVPNLRGRATGRGHSAETIEHAKADAQVVLAIVISIVEAG
jgi:hypothetical protein